MKYVALIQLLNCIYLFLTGLNGGASLCEGEEHEEHAEHLQLHHEAPLRSRHAPLTTTILSVRARVTSGHRAEGGFWSIRASRSGLYPSSRHLTTCSVSDQLTNQEPSRSDLLSPLKLIYRSSENQKCSTLY